MTVARSLGTMSGLRSTMAIRRQAATTAFQLLALVAAAVGLVLVVRGLGWSGIERAVVGVGPWFAVLLAIDLAGAACDAVALHGFLGVDGSYRRVLVAQLSGMAVNRLTPGHSLGEPVKATLLVRHVPADAAVSAVMMFNVATIYLGAASIIVGVPITALLLDLPPTIERVVWIGLGVIIALAAALAALVRTGPIAAGIVALARLRVISAARAARWRERTGPIDGRLRTLTHLGAPGVARGLAGVAGSRLLNWLGTVVVLYAAGIPMTPALVVAMLTVGILITWMSNVVPLGLGLADGTNYALYGLLGASPVAGLLFTMVNRLRTVVLAVTGLLVMLVATRRAR
jgi:hypothetical protein